MNAVLDVDSQQTHRLEPWAVEPCSTRPTPLIPRGALAAWQARRVRLYVDANLAQRLETTALADVVNLSASHFCRAFKRTFGITVHRYVMQRRVEMAQHLMRNPSADLSGIALSCGMSDQSHLTRWFRRVVGETPAAWRRARIEPTHSSPQEARARTADR
jgi:AraC family transcriptional regulator